MTVELMAITVELMAHYGRAHGLLRQSSRPITVELMAHYGRARDLLR